MTTNHETTPYEGEPDEFDLIAGDLLEVIVDPYLEDIHRQARLCEETLRELGDEAYDNAVRKEYRDYLDGLWRFEGCEIEVTGKGVFKNTRTDEIFPHYLIGEPVVSRGFTFPISKQYTGEEGLIKAAHVLETVVNGETIIGLVCIDDVVSIKLPYPSPEMRERQFMYHFEDLADGIDYFTSNAERDDQVLLALKDFSVDLDPTNSNDVEHAKNAEAFVRARVPIEKYANYEIGILGDFLVEDGGAVTSMTATKKHTRIVAIQEMVLRPTDVEHQKPTSKAAHSLFIEVAAFNMSGDNPTLYLPLRSIGKIRSLRYPDYPTS